MDITDLSGIGKPVVKFLEIIEKGVGRVYADTFGISAEARKIRLLSNAKMESEVRELAIKNPTEQRALERVIHVESNRQKNIEDVLALSFNYLPKEIENEKAPDQDWISRFFNTVQDISNDQLKEVWAKILSNEIKTPGKFSLRTLDTLRNLSHDEAKLFSKACEVAMTSSYLFEIAPNFNFLKYGINQHQIMILKEAGLLIDSDSVKSTPEFKNNKPVILGRRVIYLKNANPKIKKIEYDLILFTKAGKELADLLKIDVSDEFYEDVKKHFISNGFEIASEGALA